MDPHTTLFLPGRVGLMVRLPSRPGARPALLDAINRFADEFHGAEGLEAFVISLDPDDEDVVWIHQWFYDEAALDEHRRTEQFAGLMRQMPDLLGSAPAMMRIDPLRMDLSNTLLAGDGMS